MKIKMLYWKELVYFWIMVGLALFSAYHELILNWIERILK